MLIPRIFHQIWLGPEPFPDELAGYQRSWLDHHPGWTLRFWTEESLSPAEELRRPEAAERLRAPWERSELFRLEAVWREGGVYVDCDVECLRSIEPLIRETECFVGVDGAVLGAVAGHAILERALDEARPAETYAESPEPRPHVLDPLLAGAADVTRFELAGYAVRHRASGQEVDELRAELDALEQLVRERQAEAFEWKRRCRRARAQLAELRK